MKNENTAVMRKSSMPELGVTSRNVDLTGISAKNFDILNRHRNHAQSSANTSIDDSSKKKKRLLPHEVNISHHFDYVGYKNRLNKVVSHYGDYNIPPGWTAEQAQDLKMKMPANAMKG